MAVIDAALDATATAALLAGTAASHLSMGNVGGIISMIVKLAQTARRNKKECEQLADRVRIILDMLPYLQIREETVTRALVERLVATLQEALELVKSCQSGSMVGRVLTINLQASKLADVQRQIDSYLSIFTLFSHIQIMAALGLIRTDNAVCPTSLPPPPASQPVVPAEAAKDDITWTEVLAATSVTIVSKAAAETEVYMARLQDGRDVAIKSFDGDDPDFHAELAVLSGLRRHHIIRLLCWLESDGKRLLVYEFVGNGTLRDHLSRGEVNVSLESFALPSIEDGKLGDVLDRRPAAQPTPRQLKALNLVADMAARCVSASSSTPGIGPTMSDVVARLKEAHELICSVDTHGLV